MAKTKTFSTLDIYLAGFFTLHNQDVILELRNGKVVFTFESTDTLYRLMDDFNNNVALPVADYCTALKRLRGQMLTKKSINGHGKGNGYGAKENKL